MRRFVIIMLCAVTTSIMWGFGCASDDEGAGVGGFLSKAFRKGGSGVPVTVIKPRYEEQAVTITMPGVLMPSDRVDVKLANDVRIDTISVNVGDTVNIGTPLFQVSQEDLNLKLAQLKAELQEAQANLEKNTYFYNNRDRLIEEGRITTDQYDVLEGEVDKSEADLERVQQQISSLEAQAAAGSSVTPSPIAGIVQSKLSSVGGVAVANTPIVTITKNDPMMATFRLAAFEAKNVQRGNPVTVKIADLPGEQFIGRVASIGTELDRETSTFEVKAALANPQGILKAGMNVFVEFTGPETQRHMVIPAESLVSERRRYYVFTVVRGTAHKVRVIPRDIAGGEARILEGLRENDLVVVSGADKLSEGTVVDIWGR